MPVRKLPLVPTRKKLLSARSDFDAVCQKELASLRTSRKCNWKLVKSEPAKELLGHPAGLPSSFFRLIVEGLLIGIGKNDWKNIRLLCSTIFASEEPSCDLSSAVLALAAFLRRSFSSQDPEDLTVMKLITNFLSGANSDLVLLPSAELSDVVTGHLLVPASVFIAKFPGEPELCNSLRNFLSFAIFSPDVLTDTGMVRNPAVDPEKHQDASFFASTAISLQVLPDSEARALLSCLLRLPGTSRDIPFERMLALLCSWSDVSPETEEWTERRVSLLSGILEALNDRNILLDAPASPTSGQTLKEFFTALLSSLLRSKQNQETCLKCCLTLLDLFPTVGLDNVVEVMKICADLPETEQVFVRLLRAFAQARLVPKFLAKMLSVLHESSAWSTFDDFSTLKEKIGEEFSQLPQNQLLSVLKTFQYNFNEHLTEESFPVVASLVRNCLLNARLPAVGVSTWIENVASCLASCLNSAEKFEFSSPVEYLQLVCAFGEWTSFVLKYQEALARDLDQTAPSFAAFHRIVEAKLREVEVNSVKDSSVALQLAEVKRRLASSCAFDVDELPIMAGEVSQGKTEAMDRFNIHPESWECVSVVTSAVFAKIAGKCGNKKLAVVIKHFSSSLLQEDMKVEKMVELWASFKQELEKVEGVDVSDLLSLMTSSLPLENLPMKEKVAVFAALSTVATLSQKSEAFDALARLFDVADKNDEFIKLLHSNDSLPTVNGKSRALVDKLVTAHWNCDDRPEKKNFLKFVSSSASIEVFLTVLERKNGAWKDFARKKLNEELEKFGEVEDNVENERFLEIFSALVQEGKSNQKKRIGQLLEALKNKNDFLDSIDVKSAEFCLKILAKCDKTDVLWGILKEVRDWRRLLAIEGFLASQLAEAAKKADVVPTCGLQACYVRILKANISRDNCGGIPVSLLTRLEEEIDSGLISALGTLWIIAVTFSKLTDLECYSSRDTMAMKLVSLVKAAALDGNQESRREVFCAYLALHAVFLEKVRLNWIFFLGGYQTVMYRSLDEEEAVFDDVGVFGFTSACEVLYQALRKPGFVVTGWEHVFSRHLLWAWKLLCRWVSDVNTEETDSTSSPKARTDLVTCASTLDRVVNLVKHEHSAAFARLAPYVISDAVAALSTRSVLPELKKYLSSFVFKLLDLCDEASIKYLRVSLDGAVGEVYDKLYEDYRRYGKYVGRV